MSQSKLPHLESLRGLAAVAVVVSHVLSAFAAPALDGAPTVAGWDSPAARTVGRLLTLPVGDGRFAVAVFFVLSGVVLAQRPLRTGQPPDLLGDSVRRYVRLAGPAAVATLLGWATWHGCRPLVQAASAALTADGVSARWLGLLGPPDPSLSAALAEAGWGLYRLHPPPVDHALFNCPLWTIRTELYGSLLVFAFLAVAGRHPRVGRLAVAAALLTLALGGVFPALFLAGVGLAAGRLRVPAADLAPGTAAALVAAAVWLAGLTELDYYWWPPVETATGRIDPHNLLAGLSAVPLVGAVLFCRPLADWLSLRPLVWLGSVSFGLYLVHLPVLLTVGCGLFVLLQPAVGHGPAVLATGLVVLAVSLVGGWAVTHLVDRPATAAGKALAARLSSSDNRPTRPGPARP